MNMADEELVALLKQGSYHWNEWRKNTLRTTPDKPDLREANLQGPNPTSPERIGRQRDGIVHLKRMPTKGII
jgi:hypothetical protein